MPAQRRYPPDVMDSAVRMVLDIRRQDPRRAGVVGTVGGLMDTHPEVLRHWVKKAEAASSIAPATESTSEAATPGDERVITLERELADLRRINAVLRAAAVHFASELEQGKAG